MRLLFALLALLAAPLAGAVAMLHGRPRRPVERAGPVRSLWRGRANRLSERPLVAEGQLIRLAAAIISRVDPLMSREHARRLRELLPTFAGELPPLMPAWPEALRSLFTGRDDSNHLFVVEPEDRQTPAGLNVFLHGHGGNSVLYPHLLRDWATSRRMLVVCPTFGHGNWESPRGIAAVRRAMAVAREQLPAGATRVFLAGISQGGAGVVRAARAEGSAVSGLILISPTMEPDQLTAPWAGMPALVFQGDADHNVTAKSVRLGVELMRGAGADVTFHLLAGEDHFLFFARRAETLEILGQWMDRLPKHDA